MNKVIAILLLAVTALAPQAAHAATVKYDYDREVDFSRWTRVAWVVPAGADETMQERRVARAIETGFSARGYTLVEEPSNADFLIGFHFGAWQDVQLSSTYNGPAFGRTFRMDRQARGALIVTVIDRGTGRVAWRGMVADAIASNPDQADKRLAQAIEKLLKNYPVRGSRR